MAEWSLGNYCKLPLVRDVPTEGTKGMYDGCPNIPSGWPTLIQITFVVIDNKIALRKHKEYVGKGLNRL